MVREFVISTYLLLFRVIFNFFKLFPQKSKTVCVASFGDNIYYTTRALKDISDNEIIILKDPRCRYPFETTQKVIKFNAWHPIDYLKSIYHLATATSVLIDNYFGFLGATNFRKNTTCVQLWHAAGAIKQFGLKDPSIKKRGKKAQDRFQKVYDRFDYTTVASEKMAHVFYESFGLNEDSIIRSGIPRTDLFYDQAEVQRIIKDFKVNYPIINKKKVILYAPTYRDNQLNNYQLALDIEHLYNELSDEYVLFIKQHPAVSYHLIEKYNYFVYDVSNYFDTNHLLLFTDLLITDYSSIPFEFALLKKPMIFFAYDMKEYESTRGLMDNYEIKMPGPVVFTTNDIIKAIKTYEFDESKINSFATSWHEYSNGTSSAQIASFLTKKEEEYLGAKSY